MRLLLFAGFLGSGKTTLILALAKRAVLEHSRVCVLVNEVGEVGIDGEVLRLGDMEVVEITGGCICCQIGVDLVRALRDLEQEFEPDLVIIEASGIATPEGVLDSIRRYPPRSLTSVRTVTVVDPLRLEALYEVLTPLIEGQIAGADVIVITKADEATSGEVDAAVRRAAESSPSAPVYVVDAKREESLVDLLASVALTGRAGRHGGGRVNQDCGGAAPHSPPSAAGSLEPYGARVTIGAASRPLEPEQFLTTLLEDLAAACLASGASIIGHLKCLLRTSDGVIACNLTSIRSGATCSGPAGAQEPNTPLAPGESGRLDLAVLVYGLQAATIDTLLRQTLETLLEPLEVAWAMAESGEAPSREPQRVGEDLLEYL